jgi:hypothetical protein
MNKPAFSVPLTHEWKIWVGNFFEREKKKGRAFIPGDNYCYRWVDNGGEILTRMWGRFDSVCGSIGYRRGEYPRTTKDWSGSDINLR